MLPYDRDLFRVHIDYTCLPHCLVTVLSIPTTTTTMVLIPIYLTTETYLPCTLATPHFHLVAIPPYHPFSNAAHYLYNEYQPSCQLTTGTCLPCALRLVYILPNASADPLPHDKLHTPFRGLVICQPTARSFSI